MSGPEGSDFSESDGDYLSHESSSKRLKLADGGSTAGQMESPTGILRLHTEWVQRDSGDRGSAYVTSDADGPIPVPQSDFEIEINSSGQEPGGSPGQEISLPSTSITIPIEPRILTIDTRMSSSQSLSSPHEPTITTTVTNMPPEPIQTNLADEIQVSVESGQTDFSSLISAGRTNLMQQVTDQQAYSELPGGQFIQTTGDTASSGPLYVMIPPSTSSAELLQAMQQNQRPLMPRLSSGAMATSPVSEDGRKHKELMRKQTHNEVERRRRDRINELIKMLAEIVPGCQKKDASNGNIVGYVYSKGTVLEKTVEYVRELLLQNEQLASTAKLAEKSASAMQILQNQITVLEKENTFLRAQMVQLGIESSPGGIGTRSLLSNPLAQSLLNTQVAPPPPPAIPNTTQLLVSLAQTLTSNPLLASFSQNSSQLTPSVPQVVSTNGSQPPQTATNNQANLLMNSLVQTLASIANTNTPLPPPQQTPLPPPQASGLSATAAMSLLNSLIMAQSSTSGPLTSSSLPSPNPSSISLLTSTQSSQDKPTPV